MLSHLGSFEGLASSTARTRDVEKHPQCIRLMVNRKVVLELYRDSGKESGSYLHSQTKVVT